MNSNKRGFTLIELLVVIAMIAVIMGAISTSFTSAQQRARIQKAASEVKVITQAILAYENYNKNGKNYQLEPMGAIGAGGVDADASTLGFLLGNSEAAASSGQIPALLLASLQSGGKMLDPWGTPYKLHIKQGQMEIPNRFSSMTTRYYLPNFYRLSKEEHGL